MTNVRSTCGFSLRCKSYMKNKSGRTAIRRTRISTPMAYLKDQGKLTGKVLDFGCGRGFDCDTLGFDGYDPNFRPKYPAKRYDTITCVYVLNVIESRAERLKVLSELASLLKPKGVAYIAVRNDRSSLKGRTSSGTWQGFINLPLPVEKQTRNFVLYKLDPTLF